MATKTWIGNAASRLQISTWTFTNTWATGDTATVTINGNDLVVTLGSVQTPTGIAAAIVTAFNSSSRTDGTGADASSSNVGGQSIPEFREITASSSGAVLTLTGKSIGLNFTATIAVSTAGDGDVGSETVVQSATGRNFWNNADNWDVGSVPANGDVLIYRDSDVDCSYGLPNGSLEVQIKVYDSYTGRVGLPEYRGTGTTAYKEYRQRYVRLDDAGSATDLTHYFGIADGGTGCPLFNLKHSTLPVTIICLGTGRPAVQGTYALNVVATAATNSLQVLKGFVDASSQDSATADWNVVKVAYVSNVLNDATVLIDGATLTGTTVTQHGGTLNLRNVSGSIFDQQGGVAYLDTAVFATVNCKNGTIYPIGASNVSTMLNIYEKGLYDLTKDLTALTLASATVHHASARLNDPFRRATFTAGPLGDGAPASCINLGDFWEITVV